MFKSGIWSSLWAGFIGLVLIGDAVNAQPPAAASPNAVLVTRKMCCAHESVPAIKELSKIPGVARVVADHKTRSLTIVPKENASPSPTAIWEAAERIKLEPVRLTTTQGVYNSKPRR